MVKRTRSSRSRAKTEESMHQKAVNDINEDYLPCRHLGHAWGYVSVAKVIGTAFWKVYLDCLRCPTSKTQTVNKFGDVLSSVYNYPPDYRFTAAGGLTAADRSGVRLRVIKNVDKFIAAEPQNEEPENNSA